VGLCRESGMRQGASGVSGECSTLPVATLYVSVGSLFDSVRKLLIHAARLTTTGLGSTSSGVSQGAQIKLRFVLKSIRRVK